jgi:uncharacterized membrane protein YbhN (UPF0104 family)
MNPRHTRWFAWAALAAVLGLGAVLAQVYADRLAGIEPDWAYAWPLLALSLATILGRGLTQRTSLLPFGIHLRVWDGVGLTTVSTILNEALPLSPGIVFKPAYLKAAYGLDIAKSAVVFAASSLIFTAVACALAVLALTLVPSPPATLMLLLAIAAGLSLLPLLGMPEWVSRAAPALLRSLHLQWRNMARPPFVAKLSLQFLALGTLDGLRLWCAFLLVGSDAGFWPSLAAAGLGTLAAWAAFVPGGLGFVEGAIAAAGVLLTYDPVAAVLASLISRAFVLAPSAPLSLAWVLSHGKDARRHLRNAVIRP